MKNLHFYIQCSMLLLALSLAVLIPFENDFGSFVLILQFVLGVYQLSMSTMLMNKLSKPTKLLKYHCYMSWFYLLGILIFALSEPSWINNTFWIIYMLIIPWMLAIYFVVVIDDLEYHRNYRL